MNVDKMKKFNQFMFRSLDSRTDMFSFFVFFYLTAAYEAQPYSAQLESTRFESIEDQTQRKRIDDEKKNVWNHLNSFKEIYIPIHWCSPGYYK